MIRGPARMARSFALCVFVFGCVSRVLCSQGSCGAQPEAAALQGASGCGCDSLKRAATVEPAEDRTAPAQPADKYSRRENERLSEAQGDEEEVQSQVICQLSSDS